MTDAMVEGQSLKTALEAQSPEEFQLLRQAGLYYRLVRTLRATAWVNLVLGGLTLWAGLSAIGISFSAAVQSILGALIIIQSLLALIRPRAWSLLALAILLLLVGLWNIGLIVFVNFFSFFLSFNILWLVLGILQLWWTYRTYQLYRVFSAYPTPKPTPELAQKYNNIWEGLSHPTPALSPELLMMKLAGNRNWWNVMLLPDRAILAHKRQRFLMLVDKPDLIVVPDNPKAILRDQIAIFIRVGLESYLGKIYPGSLQQYMKWKGITDSQSELDQTTRRMRLGRKLSSGFAVLLWIAFVYGIVSAMASMSRFR